jgi:hypothetical protein
MTKFNRGIFADENLEMPSPAYVQKAAVFG